MKERPILFSAPMVRAILAGEKTQTRRAVKLPVLPDTDWFGGWKIVHKMVTLALATFNERLGKMVGKDPSVCPYGQPGDRLWVRETHAQVFEVDIPKDRPVGPFGTAGSPAKPNWKSRYVYRADGEMPNVQWRYVGDKYPVHWTPSIHMPRAASRILLEIVSVRVERLRDISEADARAEGIERKGEMWSLYGQGSVDRTYSPRTSFRALWLSINGAGSWDANPWVWVIEFKLVTP